MKLLYTLRYNSIGCFSPLLCNSPAARCPLTVMSAIELLSSDVSSHCIIASIFSLSFCCVSIPRHVFTFTDSSQRGATNIGSFRA